MGPLQLVVAMVVDEMLLVHHEVDYAEVVPQFLESQLPVVVELK